MRQIKFRAFDKVSKNMSPPFSLFGEFTLLGAVFAWLDHYRGLTDCTSGISALNDVEIMQFTGLKDVNGVDIYESDIVESDCYSQGAWFGRAQPRTKYVIKYSDYSGRFCFKQTDRQDNINTMKVIGNIHQHSDLLECK